jgi:hypothetical protein
LTNAAGSTRDENQWLHETLSIMEGFGLRLAWGNDAAHLTG